MQTMLMIGFFLQILHNEKLNSTKAEIDSFTCSMICSLLFVNGNNAFNNYSQVINFEIYIIQERCLKISKYLVYFNLILQTRF